MSRPTSGNAGRMCCGGKRSAQVFEKVDLLPDFPGEAGGQIFHVVNCVKQDRVLEFLHVQRGDFADQRERLAAIIQISVQLEWRHNTALGRGSLRAPPEIALGILGQLMHVHNVRHGPEFVNRFQGAVAFDARFP